MQHRTIEHRLLRGVARAGFEPATFHFSGERCYQLSYLALRPPAVRNPPNLLTSTEAAIIRRRMHHCSRDPDGTRTRDLRRDRAAR